MSHRNARLTVCGRQLLCRRVCEDGWRMGEAALAVGVSRQTHGLSASATRRSSMTVGGSRVDGWT
jgi:hypothetical protein